MNYSCEYQDEVQSALWSGEVLLYLLQQHQQMVQAKVFLYVQTQQVRIRTLSQHSFFSLYENHLLPSPGIAKEIIWSDGPSSEFKNKFTMKLLSSIVDPLPQKVFMEVFGYFPWEER